MAKKKHDVKAPALSQSDTKDDDGSIELLAGPSQKSLVAERIIAAFEQLDFHDGGNETVVDVIDVVDSDDGDEEAASSALKLLHAKPSPRKRAKIGDDAIVHVDSQPPEPTTVAWWEYEECSQQMF